MTGILDDIEIPIPCEQCRRKIPKRIGWIKTHHQLTCPCGTVIGLDTHQLAAEIVRVEKALAALHLSLDERRK